MIVPTYCIFTLNFIDRKKCYQSLFFTQKPRQPQKLCMTTPLWHWCPASTPSTPSQNLDLYSTNSSGYYHPEILLEVFSVQCSSCIRTFLISFFRMVFTQSRTYQPPKQDFELGLLISFANRLTGSVQHELKLLFIILRLLFELLQSPSSGRPPFFDFFTLLAIYTTNPRLRPVSLLFIIFPQNYFRVFLIGPFYSLPVVFPLFGPLLWELFIKTTSCYRNLLMSFKCVIFDMQKPEVNMVIFVMFRGATWLQIRTFVWLLVLNRDRHFHLL